MDQAMIALLAGMVLLLILLVVVLVVLAQERRSRERMEQEMAAAQSRNLHELQEQLLSAFGSMTGSYGEHINTVLHQNYEQEQLSEQHRISLERTTAEHLLRMEREMEALRSLMEDRLSRLEERNTRQLEQMRQTVDEKLSETLNKRLNESFARVSERLEQVYRSLGEVHSLAGGVNDLKHMLGSVKTRGVWGEIQLGALLSETMTQSQYQSNVMVVPGSGERVEFAVCLPGRDGGERPVYLPIDSKFPLEQYIRLANASRDGEEGAAEAARKALMAAVKTEAKRIGKYIAPPHSTDFAIMFLPLESLYAEVMCHTEEAEQIRRENHILIAGPSTLQAMLSSLQMGFRTLAIEKRSAEVWKLLGAVKNDFRNYALLLEKTREKLKQASDSVDDAFSKTRTIERRLRNVESTEGLEASEESLQNSQKVDEIL